MQRTLAILTVLGLVVGCARDDRYGAPLRLSDAEIDATYEMLDSTVALRSLANPDEIDEDTVGDVLAVMGSGQMLLFSKLAAEAPRSGSLTTDRAVRFDPACIERTATQVVYSSCELGPFVLDGVLAVDDDSMSIDLHLEGAFDGQQLTMAAEGTIRWSGDRIWTEDELRYAFQVTGQGQSVDFQLATSFDVVATPDCPQGIYELHAQWGVEGDADAALDEWVRIEFGPGCGDVRVY